MRNVWQKIVANKKQLMLIALLVVVVIVGLLITSKSVLAQASSTVDPSTINVVTSGGSGGKLTHIQEWVLQAVGTLASWIVAMLGKLLSVVIGILISIAQYNGFINSPVVTKGWVLIRDICNMFFVVILIIMAFGTVFQKEQYSYKRLLASMVFAAVLVNFSKAICGIIIDFSQVIMLTFINAVKAAAAGNFAEMIGLRSIVSITVQGSEGAAGPVNLLQTVIAYGLAEVLLLVALVVFVVITIIILLRIVQLWFLVILSPLAFLATVGIPRLSAYSSKWWDRFGKQVIIGPVLAIFLWLSLAVVADSFNKGTNQLTVGMIQKSEITAGAAGNDKITAAVTDIGTSGGLLGFIVGIAMLIASLSMAQEMGVAGGALAGKAASGMKSFAQGATKMPWRGAKKFARDSGITQAVQEVGSRGLGAVGKNKFVDWMGSHTPIKLGTKEQRENWDIKRKGRIAEQWGGKKGAREIAEQEIQYRRQKALEEKVGPLRRMKDSKVEELRDKAGKSRSEERKIYQEELATRKKLKPDDIMGDADDAWSSNRTSDLDSIANNAEKQGDTSKDAFDASYVHNDVTGKWRKRLTRAQIAAIKAKPSRTAEEDRQSKDDEKALDKIDNDITRKAKASNEIRIGDLVEAGKEINLAGTTSPAALKLMLERICALDDVALGRSTSGAQSEIIKQLDHVISDITGKFTKAQQTQAQNKKKSMIQGKYGSLNAVGIDNLAANTTELDLARSGAPIDDTLGKICALDTKTLATGVAQDTHNAVMGELNQIISDTTRKYTANQVAAAVAKQNEVIQQLERISSSGAAGGFSGVQMKMAQARESILRANVPKIHSNLKPQLNSTIIPLNLSGLTVDAGDDIKMGNLANDMATLRTSIETKRTSSVAPNDAGAKYWEIQMKLLEDELTNAKGKSLSQLKIKELEDRIVNQIAAFTLAP